MGESPKAGSRKEEETPNTKPNQWRASSSHASPTPALPIQLATAHAVGGSERLGLNQKAGPASVNSSGAQASLGLLWQCALRVCPQPLRRCALG